MRLSEYYEQRIESKRLFWSLFLLVLMAGAFFRLNYLDESSLRGDTIVFWNVYQHDLTPSQIWSGWMERMGKSGQMPFAMAYGKFFLDVFHLPLTHFTARLPMALLGILTIVVAYGIGRLLGGRLLGLMVAGLLAFSPFHIQISREIYYYPPMVLGAFLTFFGLLLLLDDSDGKGWAKWRAVMLFLLGFFLLIYSQVSGWTFAFLCAATAGITSAWGMIRRRKVEIPGLFLMGGILVIGLPLLFLPWGISQVDFIYSDAASQTEFSKYSHTVTIQWWQMLARILFMFAWGNGVLRMAITVLLLLAGIAFLLREWRKEKRLLLLPVFLVLGFLLFLYARERGSNTFEARYITSLLSLYLILLAGGLIWLINGLGVLSRGQEVRWIRWMGAVVLVWIIMLNSWPAYLSTRLVGNPAPYKKITEWVEHNLVDGTPVLIDRWFEPWNELAVYPPTNATYTFTVPNEPPNVYVQSKWRETAKAFFQRFPHAAYAEVAKTYQDLPEIGTWDWPDRHFAQRASISNTPGLKLRELGLVGRGDFYAPNSNRLVVCIYYNTCNDHLLQAQQAGQSVAVWPGVGWQYEKTGPMQMFRIRTQGFQDWYRLDEKAELKLFNLAGEPVSVTLTLKGVALGGQKNVRSDQGVKETFPPGQLKEWVLGPMVLKPGENLIHFEDTLWPRHPVPLLVEGFLFHVQDG